MQNIITVDFHGQPILTICEDGQHYVGMKAVCENIGLGWHGQWERINRHAILKEGIRVIRTPSNGGEQSMICLPLEYLNGWLFGVDVSRIKDAAVRERLTQYQRECFTVLYNYWHSGKAENPRLSTVADRVPLKDAVNLLVARAGISYSDAYRMVHQRFGVNEVEALTREQIPQAIAYVHELTVKAAAGKGPLHGLLQEDKGKVAAIALMHTGWLRFAEHQNALEAVRRQVVGILDTLDAILSGSGAVYDGLYEAQVRLGLNSRILREGHALAESRYRPRITA